MTTENEQQTSTVPEDAPRTAAEQIERSRSGNRALALGLIAVSLVFLAGAVGVGLLAQYGPY